MKMKMNLINKNTLAILHNIDCRSHHPLSLNDWHKIKVSRTGLLAEIEVDQQKRVSHIGAGAFTQVSTSGFNVYIGGVPTFDILSPYIPIKSSFDGCIQKVDLFYVMNMANQILCL